MYVKRNCLIHSLDCIMKRGCKNCNCQMFTFNWNNNKSLTIQISRMNNFLKIIYSNAFVKSPDIQSHIMRILFFTYIRFSFTWKLHFYFVILPKDIRKKIKVIAVITKTTNDGNYSRNSACKYSHSKIALFSHSIIAVFTSLPSIPLIWLSDLFCFVFLDGFYLTLFDYVFVGFFNNLNSIC